MMLNTLTEHLELLTTTHTPRSASGRGSGNKLELTGIKKLRELILELAVRGKLVPQNPEDEPASVLLERIAAEKGELIAEGKIKRQKPLPALSNEESSSELPAGWAWARLGDVMNVLNGRAYKKHEMLQEGTPLLRVGNLFTSNEWYCSDLDLEPEKYIDNGDLIYAWSASFGPFIWEGDKAIYHYHIWKLDLYHKPSLNKHYLYNYLLAITEHIKASGSGIAMIHMTKERMEKLVLPIPPLTEQHRIVAKVDELMALCDQLEQEETDSIAAHQALVDAMLTTLTDSKDAAELAENWSLVAEHFDTLFTTEASIARLRQTILQLAVMGRLVPQNPDNEPAARLLERIAAEKAQLIKDGKIKKQKPSIAITDEEQFFSLPEGWTWCRIDHLALHSEAGWSPKCNDTPRTDDHWGVLKVSAITWGKYRPAENKQLPDHLEPRPEYEVQPNDFLISRANTADLVARSVVVPETAPEHLMMSDKIIRFVFSSEVSSHYINLYNNCRFARDYYASVAGGTSSSMKNVSRQQIQSLVLPLPSLAEQQRIQVRVNELMALCNTLQQQVQQTQTTQQQLASALVEQAITAHNQPNESSKVAAL